MEDTREDFLNFSGKLHPLFYTFTKNKATANFEQLNTALGVSEAP